MVLAIYETIKGILWSNFPKNQQGYPVVFDRAINYWIIGGQKILPAALGVVLKGSVASIQDIGEGLREYEYSIKMTFYSSNDDQETSEKVVQEGARIANSILSKHRSMWVCDLCPFCGELPLSPIHYIDNGVITSVGITTAVLPANQDSYKISIAGSSVIGFPATAVIRLSEGISGKVTNCEILSCGLGINTTFYTDQYAQLTFGISSGSGHVGMSTTILNQYALNVTNQINQFWAETHQTPAPEYLDWPGVSCLAVTELVSDWSAGFKPSALSDNNKWNANLNSVSNDNVVLNRVLQDIQISQIIPSDDGEEAFLHTAEFTFKAKEIVSVSQFGPNNVEVNAV